MLEGGYDLDALTTARPRSCDSWPALAGADSRAAGTSSGATSAGPGAAAVDAVARHWQQQGSVVIPDRFRPVLDELSPLTERFAAAGHRLYLVGGTVRDLLIADDADDRRLRRHHRRAAGRDQGVPRGLGRRDLDAGRALRHDRRQEGRADLRDHDPSRRGVQRRLAQAGRRVRRRHRGRPVAPRLHGQRHGARADRGDADARRSVRWRRRPRDPHAAYAAVAGSVVQRRSAADAARGAVHRPATNCSRCRS